MRFVPYGDVPLGIWLLNVKQSDGVGGDSKYHLCRDEGRIERGSKGEGAVADRIWSG